jgi:hypothetical protein
MPPETENPAHGGAAGPPNVPCSPADTPEMDQNSPRAQAPITDIEREFRRDEVFDAAAEATNYLVAIRGMVAADDVPGLRYCAMKFVAYARVVAAGCKVLTNVRGAP